MTRFDSYWKSEGEGAFRAAGITPTDSLYQGELENYLVKCEEKNGPLVPEKHIAWMKENFRKWWETGGKKSYAVNEIAPDDALYQKELDRYIQGYAKTVLEYRLSFFPDRSGVLSILTSWILFPGALSFVVFAAGFLFAMRFLIRRWGCLQPAIVFAAGIVAAGIVFMGTLPLSYFERYSDTPFTGASMPLAVLLGVVAFGPRNGKPGRIVTGISFFLFAADLLLNWNVNPDLYGWVSFLSPAFFALGAFLGIKMPRFAGERTGTRLTRAGNAEKRPSIDVKAASRKALREGFDLANKAEYEHASSMIAKAYGNLFKENPPDKAFILTTTESLFYPHYYLTIPSMQWMEWGAAAAAIQLFEIAVRLYEKGASLELDGKIRRRARFYAGEIRLQNHLDEEKGRDELGQVIGDDSSDILASEARRLLGK